MIKTIVYLEDTSKRAAEQLKNSCGAASEAITSAAASRRTILG